jgi:hypothetical protein
MRACESDQVIVLHIPVLPMLRTKRDVRLGSFDATVELVVIGLVPSSPWAPIKVQGTCNNPG